MTSDVRPGQLYESDSYLVMTVEKMGADVGLDGIMGSWWRCYIVTESSNYYIGLGERYGEWFLPADCWELYSDA